MRIPARSGSGRATSTPASTFSAAGQLAASTAATASARSTTSMPYSLTATGQPREVSNAICMHEEDYGVLWKHTDIFTESAETRRQRRLVISFFVTVGVYDYGFYWYLYLDGTIQLEVKATGVVFTSAYRADSRYANEVAPGLGAPYHQHLYCARLDMMVDGVTNTVDELDAEPIPVGPANPYGNAFTRRATRLRTESEAARTANPTAGRTWRVSNPNSTNRLGPAGRVRAAPRRATAAAGRPVLVHRAPRGVRDEAAVGHPVRPGRAVPGRRADQPAPWRRRVCRSSWPRNRPIDGEDIVAVAHVRRRALPPARGLAGDAGRVLRLHPQAGRLLRPQPDPRRAGTPR